MWFNFLSMPISEVEFRNALSCFASGVTVVTTVDAAGGFHGLTVSAFCSVSLAPPMVLVCIEKATASHYAFFESRAFAVHTLNDNQRAVSEHFATPLADKFNGLNFAVGIDGVPILADSLMSLECRIVNTFEGGDHTIFLGQVERSTVNAGKPLVYFQGEYRQIDL
jgi:flavin reductase (DIM6/NTAB) family NADH-FMN oxidoreductase RutF